MKRKFATDRRSVITVVICLVLLVSSVEVFSQAENLVRNRLQRVALGEGAQVRQELPDLLADFPNDPGVVFLHATLVDDASRAIPLYERIVRDYPNSEWADDAQWRLVQIYAVLRDTDKARRALVQFRSNYPNSEFLIHAAGIVKMTVGGDDAATRAQPLAAATSDEPTSLAAEEVEMPGRAEPMQVTPSNQTETSTSPPANSEGGGGVAVGGSSAGGVAVGGDPNGSSIAADPDGTRYTLQVGLYSSAESAQAELGRFTRFRMRAEIIEKNLNGTPKYAVTIGDYSTRDSAERARATVKKYCNCTPFIVARN